MKIIRRTVMAGLIAAGADSVVAFAPVPPGGTLEAVTGELHLIGPAAATGVTDTDSFSAFGFGGELVADPDPENTIALDALWDTMVSKPVTMNVTAALGTAEWDWDTADLSPQVELGVMNQNQLTGMGDPTKTIMEPRFEFTSFAKGRQGGFQAGTPGFYQPTAYKTFRSQRKLRAEKFPHYALLALSSPDMDEEQTTKTTLADIQPWAILSHLREAMQDMWKIQIPGLTQSGAVSPYDQMSLAIENLVAPEMIQPATDLIIPTAWTWMCSAAFVLDFPDSVLPRTLKAL